MTKCFHFRLVWFQIRREICFILRRSSTQIQILGKQIFSQSDRGEKIVIKYVIIFPLLIANEVRNNAMFKAVFRLAAIFLACVNLHRVQISICQIGKDPVLIPKSTFNARKAHISSHVVSYHVGSGFVLLHCSAFRFVSLTIFVKCSL